MEVTIEKFNPWKDSLISGILLVIFGIILMAFPNEALDWILIIIGVLFVLCGIVNLVGWAKSKLMPTLVMGAVMLVLGIVLIVLNEFAADFLMILLGVALLIFGIVTFLGMSSGFAITNGSRILNAIVGILFIIMGIYALVNWEGAERIVMLILGALLFISGLFQLYEGYQQKRASA